MEINQFCQIETSSKQEYLFPWLKENSLNLISGWRGVGKTFFGISILDAVSRGKGFGPWECKKSVPCLLLDGEMAVQDIIERSNYLNLNTDRKNPLYIYSDAFANRLGISRAHLANESWWTKMKSILKTRKRTGIRAQLKLGQFSLEKKREKPIPLFKHCAEDWIEITVPATCKETTTSDYEAILDNHVYPFFEDLKINEITEGKIKELLFSKVNAGKAGSTISHIKNVVSGVLNQAVDDDLILVNPALNLGTKFMKKINDAIESRKASNGNEGKGEPDPLTQKELKLLLDKVQKHFTEHYPLSLLLARTGIRIGEALGLRWGDIDFNGRFINLKRSLSRGKITTLKGKRGRRFDISLQLAEALKAHMVKSKEKGMKLGLGDHPEYVFTNSLGVFLDVSNWRRRVFVKALEKAELRQIRIHDLRHTYATLRISKGDNIADVSNQLGHFSETFTMKIYYHWMLGKKKAEVDELDDQEFRDQNKANDETKQAV